MVLAFFNHAHTESTNVVEYIYLLPSVCWILNNSEQPLQAALKSHFLHHLSQLKKKYQSSKLYMGQLNTFLRRMNLGASLLQQPKPAGNGSNLFARQALLSGPGDDKDSSESQGFEVACLQHSLWLYKYKAGAVPSKFSLERFWSLNDPKSLFLPPWQPLQKPRLCVPCCFHGSAPGKMWAREVILAFFPGYIHCKTEDQLFPPLLQLQFSGHRFICSRENRSQLMQWGTAGCWEPSSICPVRTVFTLIPPEEQVGTGEVDSKGPFHNFAFAKVHFRVTVAHFVKFALTVPSARVYFRTATPKGKEPHPSLPVRMLQQA